MSWSEVGRELRDGGGWGLVDLSAKLGHHVFRQLNTKIPPLSPSKGSSSPSLEIKQQATWGLLFHCLHFR